MKSARWIDQGVMPPVPVPTGDEEALAYLTEVLGHVCYERWTFTRLKIHYPSLADAKAGKPMVFRLLLDRPCVVEFWERGRLRVLAEDEAPPTHTVLERLLHTHRRRFQPIRDGLQAWTGDGAVDLAEQAAWLPADLFTWLARGGRYVNRLADTNTLAVLDDVQAVALFLRDRASRSSHTLRAYRSELKKLATWCIDRRVGPLSDLTRGDLLAYRDAVRGVRTSGDGALPRNAPSDYTKARALAVAASLYQYWVDTGYLTANPAAGLVAGTQSRSAFVPQRTLPSDLLALCDAWVDEAMQCTPEQDISAARRRAIWALYRYAGVRLVELAWSIATGLPRIEAESLDCWTLHVNGKGNKPRSVPLPAACVAVLRQYRLVRGLPSEPAGHEQVPLIHGFKGGSLQEAGLYAEVKRIFEDVADRLQADDPGRSLLLRAASPHWLRHAYAKNLVVEHRVPLPVAQALLGHASVQTTAAYAKTDLSQLREFVEASFIKDR